MWYDYVAVSGMGGSEPVTNASSPPSPAAGRAVKEEESILQPSPASAFTSTTQPPRSVSPIRQQKSEETMNFYNPAALSHSETKIAMLVPANTNDCGI